MKANPSKHNMSRRQLCRMLSPPPPPPTHPHPHALISPSPPIPPMSYSPSSPHPFFPVRPFSCLPSPEYHHHRLIGRAGCEWTAHVVALISRMRRDLFYCSDGSWQRWGQESFQIKYLIHKHRWPPESRRVEVHVIPLEDSGTFGVKEPKTGKGILANCLSSRFLSLRLNVRF